MLTNCIDDVLLSKEELRRMLRELRDEELAEAGSSTSLATAHIKGEMLVVEAPLR